MDHMDASGVIDERCVCQICTCGRHRCRKHPQQETLELTGKRHSAEQLVKSSLAQTDYALSRPIERPVIKKLVDNLQVSGGTLEAKPSLRTDYPEFDVKRPVIHRLNDQLKTSGQAVEVLNVNQAEFTTLSQDEYRPLAVRRPEGGRKLRSSLKVVGSLDAVSTNHSNYQDHENYVRPTTQRIPDKIKLEGEVADSSVSNQDFRQFKAERPVIRRLTSSLRIPNGAMDQVQTLSQETYKEMQVSRPKRHVLADQLPTGHGELVTKAGHLHEDYKQFTAERPVIRKLQDNLSVPSMAKFEAQSMKNDYPELPDYTKPVRKKMEDTLKFSGPMEPVSQAKKDYVEFHAERPVIKKLQDNIPVHPPNGVNVQLQSVQRDYGQFEAKRPVIHRLQDNLRMEGGVEAQSAYAASYRPGEPVRPEIKRMHSTLGLARGDFTKESVIRADFPEHSVARPHIAKPVNQLQPHDASWGPAGERPAAGSRRSNRQKSEAYANSGPSMSRVRQMESHIPFGKGEAVQSMMSTVKESYVPLDGAQKAKLARPPTSNRIQDWPNGAAGLTSRTAANNRANLQLQQADALKHIRDQVAARKKHQVTDSSVPINQPGQQLEADGSLYKKSYVLPAIEPCPAAVLGVEDKSGYQFTREMHNHRFYKPVDGVA